MDGGKHQVKSHRRASKWPICYNTTRESTRSWRHNQGAFLSRKCSLPCFQMTLILYPNLKSNMEPKVFGWDDSPENQGEKSQVVEKRFVFERSFSSGIHFFLAPSTGRTHGPSPCGQAATWCPSGTEDEDEEWCLVGASNPPNGPPSSLAQIAMSLGAPALQVRMLATKTGEVRFEDPHAAGNALSLDGQQYKGYNVKVQAWPGGGSRHHCVEAVSVQFFPTPLPQWNGEAERGCRWTWPLMMVPRYWSWACVVPRNCITGKNSKTGKGPKWCVKMERHPKLGDKVKPPTEVSVEIPSSLRSFRTEAASLRPPECGWQDVKDLMRERGGSTDVWLVKVKGWNINKGGC